MIETNNNTVYFLDGKMYINVTNLCTNKCIFCIRSLKDDVQGANLWLENQSACADEIISQIKEKQNEIGDEIVFCGYGEPLIELETVKTVAKFIKENYKNVAVRVNTNGHANLIHKRNVIPELTGLIDKISVSLNSDNAEQYKELTKCSYEAELAYNAVKEFIKLSKEAGIKTNASVVVGYKDVVINVENCLNVAKNLGVELRVRKWLDEGY